jgi:hypothetical protein
VRSSVKLRESVGNGEKSELLRVKKENGGRFLLLFFPFKYFLKKKKKTKKPPKNYARFLLFCYVF